MGGRESREVSERGGVPNSGKSKKRTTKETGERQPNLRYTDLDHICK